MHASFNFYSSAAMVGRANSTDSAAGWKSMSLFQLWTGRGWKRVMFFQTLPKEAERAQLNALC